MTAPVHFEGVKSAQGAKRPEGQMNVWTMGREIEQGGGMRRDVPDVLYSVGGWGDRLSWRRCGDWPGSNLTAVSAYVDLHLGKSWSR